MSQEEEIKIILLGECSVGKTSIINCFMNREFQTHELSTIGVEQTRKKIKRVYGFLSNKRFVL